jgi:hypothetical protein
MADIITENNALAAYRTLCHCLILPFILITVARLCLSQRRLFYQICISFASDLLKADIYLSLKSFFCIFSGDIPLFPFKIH